MKSSNVSNKVHNDMRQKITQIIGTRTGFTFSLLFHLLLVTPEEQAAKMMLKYIEKIFTDTNFPKLTPDNPSAGVVLSSSFPLLLGSSLIFIFCEYVTRSKNCKIQYVT